MGVSAAVGTEIRQRTSSGRLTESSAPRGIVEERLCRGDESLRVSRPNERASLPVLHNLAHASDVRRYNGNPEGHRFFHSRGDTFRARLRGQPKQIEGGSELGHSRARVDHEELPAHPESERLRLVEKHPCVVRLKGRTEQDEANVRPPPPQMSGGTDKREVSFHRAEVAHRSHDEIGRPQTQ